MFKHILLPTDGSDLSGKAIEEGIRLAQSIGAKVTALNVMPQQPTLFYHARISPEALAEAARQAKAAANAHLEEVRQKAAAAGVACEAVFESNDSPYEAIIQLAEKRGCDLILMASHGRKGVGAMLIGSETQKVLTHSRIPVLVVR
ncbi:MAG: universal stress protein [Desulfobacterales bacterium]|jgi:nucleotide-binding universal stress UspA family protein|nr:universal stress protein [Desulfobacterales bacterium]